MDFAFNKNNGETAFNHTLIPFRIKGIFWDLRKTDEKLDKLTETELSDIEALLHSVADENRAVANLTTGANHHGYSVSDLCKWEARCIVNTCLQAAGGIKHFRYQKSKREQYARKWSN